MLALVVLGAAVVAALICAWFGYWVGGLHGHQTGGFLLGLVFGPLGVLIAVLLPDADLAAPNRPSRRVEAARLRV